MRYSVFIRKHLLRKVEGDELGWGEVGTLQKHGGHDALRGGGGTMDALELGGVGHYVYVAVRVAGEIHEGGAKKGRDGKGVCVYLGGVQ